jgi:cysteine desulfurase
MINGGGQERGMRSGTLPTPLCVGLGEACAIAEKEMGAESERLRMLRDRMYKSIMGRLSEVYLNGDLEHRIPGNLNISFAYVEGEGLMMGIKDLAVSSGSACTSASLEPSYVLRALGVGEELAHTSLRLGLGRFSSEEEVDYAVDKIVGEVERLRQMSPLWEMAQEGIDISSIEWADH